MKRKSGTNWIQDLSHRIAPIGTAMLTTWNGQTMHSRPMITTGMDEKGELWFFTSVHSVKVDDIKKGAVVNVSYADPDEQVFVSITGIARITYDRERIDELWRPVFNTWFENGREDPSLVLLNIRISHAEYWDASEYKMRNMLSAFGSLLKGDAVQVTSEHQRIDLEQSKS
jgi:general stress protein 26